MRVSQLGMIDIYTSKIKQRWQENIKEVRELLANGDEDFMTKITNASNRWGISEEEIIKSVSNDLVAAAHFAKDPIKQNIYELAAAEHISKQKYITCFKKLPNNKLVIIKGEIRDKKDTKSASGAKSIDFSWSYKGIKVYASHKHTNQEGGAQDNQYQDLQNFIREARGNKDKGIVFIAIADGPYYKRNDSIEGMSRMEVMERMCTPSVKVCHIYELEETLKKLYKDS